jgi:hypothetical protein
MIQIQTFRFNTFSSTIQIKQETNTSSLQVDQKRRNKTYILSQKMPNEMIQQFVTDSDLGTCYFNLESIHIPCVE